MLDNPNPLTPDEEHWWREWAAMRRHTCESVMAFARLFLTLDDARKRIKELEEERPPLCSICRRRHGLEVIHEAE